MPICRSAQLCTRPPWPRAGCLGDADVSIVLHLQCALLIDNIHCAGGP